MRPEKREEIKVQKQANEQKIQQLHEDWYHLLDPATQQTVPIPTAILANATPIDNFKPEVKRVKTESKKYDLRPNLPVFTPQKKNYGATKPGLL
jgi:hypothetical protein